MYMGKIPLGKGILYLSRMPTPDEVGTLPHAVTVCLLKERELLKYGLKGLYDKKFRLWVSRPHSAWTIRFANLEFEGVAEMIMDMLEGGTNVHVHCYQGIHRTSTCALNVMRKLGYSEDEAYNTLAKHYPVAVRHMKDWRKYDTLPKSQGMDA